MRFRKTLKGLKLLSRGNAVAIQRVESPDYRVIIFAICKIFQHFLKRMICRIFRAFSALPFIPEIETLIRLNFFKKGIDLTVPVGLMI